MITSVDVSLARDFTKVDALVINMAFHLSEAVEGCKRWLFTLGVAANEVMRLDRETRELDYLDEFATYVIDALPFEVGRPEKRTFIQALCCQFLPALRQFRKRVLWNRAHPRDEHGRFIKRLAVAS